MKTIIQFLALSNLISTPLLSAALWCLGFWAGNLHARGPEPRPPQYSRSWRSSPHGGKVVRRERSDST